jgi:thiol:disulfide interchange protein
VLFAAAGLAAVPVVGSAWQSGRLANQASTQQSTAALASNVEMPVLAAAAADTPSQAARVQPGKTGINWEHSLSSALKTASDENKLVVVDVYADWCGVCRMMDRTIYSDPKVASLSNKVIFLKLKADDRGEGNRFAAQNHVSGLPTTIILDQKGAVVNQSTGYIGSPASFIKMVERSLARK